MDDDPSTYAWQTLASETVCRALTFDVTRDRLRHPRGGHELDYFVVRPRHEAAGVVAVDDGGAGGGGRVLLVRQWRHTVQRLLWEVPAGALDDGETPRDAAARELREETGYDAAHLEPLYRFHPRRGRRVTRSTSSSREESAGPVNMTLRRSTTSAGSTAPKLKRCSTATKSLTA